MPGKQAVEVKLGGQIGRALIQVIHVTHEETRQHMKHHIRAGLSGLLKRIITSYYTSLF